MEILFRNLRGTRKLCMETPAAEINGIPQRDYLAIKELVERNPGYTWEPVRSGYAASNNIPLIPSYQWREVK